MSTAAEGAGNKPAHVSAKYWRNKAKEENKKDQQGDFLTGEVD